MTHPDFLTLGRRLGNLALSGRLTDAEAGHVVMGLIALTDARLLFWDELSALADEPLPDPACRPSAAKVFAFLDDRTLRRDFTLMLGHFHRVNDYATRLEAKYGEGAA